MKKAIAAFFSKCRDGLRRVPDSPTDPYQADFEESFKSALAYVKKYPSVVAYDMALDWEEQKFRNKQFEMEEKLADSEMGIEANHKERKQRSDPLIESRRSYKPPAAGRSPQRDEPDLEP